MKSVLVEELTKEEKEWINHYHAQVYEKLSPLLSADEAQWLKAKCAAV